MAEILRLLQYEFSKSDPKDPDYTRFDSGLGPNGVPDGWFCEENGDGVVLTTPSEGSDSTSEYELDLKRCYYLLHLILLGEITDHRQLSRYLDS